MAEIGFTYLNGSDIAALEKAQEFGTGQRLRYA